MVNPLFNEQMQKGFGSFMNNPMQFLMKNKINIPQEYMNNPHQAVQYLLNNGQMTQDQLNHLTQMAQKMGIKL